MSEVYRSDKARLIVGDSAEVLRTLPDASVDAVVADPPYGLAFMGKKWDYDVPSVELWAQCLRVLRPGGHLLAFAGTRTQHRMAVRIEDAGFEIRDMIAWVYGSGFPKSLDVSKAIDKADGHWRGRAGAIVADNRAMSGPGYERTDKGEPVTDAARRWHGWGTALKPALEPITVARKPLSGTVAENVLAHGTGALNIDACRVPHDGESFSGYGPTSSKGGWDAPWKHDPAAVAACRQRAKVALAKAEQLGRWPANLIHDGSPEPTTLLGEAARFYYTAKASSSERGDGNIHPTVKPVDLMRYLCRLVTPPRGLVLDPFCGSGSTGVAAVIEGFRFLGVEREAAYATIAADRIGLAEKPATYIPAVLNAAEPAPLFGGSP